MKKKVGFARIAQKSFFENKLFLFNEESKLFLKTDGKSFAKKLDKVLCKVRLNTFKGNLSLKEKRFFYQTLKGKPVYIIQNKTDFNVLDSALKLEDFYAVFFCENAKKQNFLYENKINIISSKNKKLHEMLKKLDINTVLPNKIEIIFKKEQFSFVNQFKKTAILTQGYLLEKYQNNEIDFFVYRLFVGECISYVIIKNKLDNKAQFNFEYFYDLADDKINYFEFDKKQNFVLIKNLKNDLRFYFNFSTTPNFLSTSAINKTEKSNLPCLHLKYSLKLEANQTKKIAFMFSKTIQPLPFLNFKNLLIKSKNSLDEMFVLSIDFLSVKENAFFNKIISQAYLELLQGGKVSFFWFKQSYQVLKNKFLKNEISAFCFYLSVKNSLATFDKSKIIINPYFFQYDFVVNFKNNFNKIHISKNNLKVPYLIMDGVKYYNHFAIPYSFLKNKSVCINM